MKNWRTSVVGVLVAVSAWLSCAIAVLDADMATEPNYTLAVTMTVAAVGLLFAKDAATKD